MKYIFQAALIFLFTFLGELLARLIPLPVPAAIWGLVLLFAALCLKVVKAEQIRESAGFLVAILPVLFVAPTVGLMDHAAALLPDLPAALVIVLLSTVLTFAVSGLVTKWIIKKGDKKDE